MGAAAAGFIVGACCAASVRACVRGRVGKGRGGSAGACARPGRGGRGGASAEGVWSQDARKRAFRGSAVGIFPSPAFPLLSKGPTARDDGGVATPTARTGNGSARSAYAPARRISRASGAGT